MLLVRNGTEPEWQAHNTFLHPNLGAVFIAIAYSISNFSVLYVLTIPVYWTCKRVGGVTFVSSCVLMCFCLSNRIIRRLLLLIPTHNYLGQQRNGKGRE